MNRLIATALGVCLTCASLVGCSSDAYDPKADSAKLSSYATTDRYPSGSAEAARGLTCSVDGNGTITVRNASDGSISQFDLWVNKAFVLQVRELPAKTKTTFAPELFYNNNGQNLTSVKSDSISLVEIAEDGKLLKVDGPIKE